MIIQAINDVCAQAPEGIDKYTDLLLGWVKYGVAAVIIGAGFVSVGAMVVGKLGSLSRAAQVGASGPRLLHLGRGRVRDHLRDPVGDRREGLLMAARLTVARMLAAPEQWNRRKLQVLLGVGALVVLAVLVGIVWSVTALLARDGDADSTADVSTGGALVTIGADETTLEDAQPGPLATSRTGTIRVPQPTQLGENQVATGFPPTSEGAMAQLIAIDQRAIQSVSVVTAQDVIDSWAAPGGPTAETWSGVEAVRTLLESAGLPASGSTEMAVELRPAMGFILTAQPRAVTPCVDFVLTVTVTDAESSRIAVADCQHMLWSGGRWVIAPGKEPDPSPSLWPGTQASYDAGYLWLEVLP